MVRPFEALLALDVGASQNIHRRVCTHLRTCASGNAASNNNKTPTS